MKLSFVGGLAGGPGTTELGCPFGGGRLDVLLNFSRSILSCVDYCACTIPTKLAAFKATAVAFATAADTNFDAATATAIETAISIAVSTALSIAFATAMSVLPSRPPSGCRRTSVSHFYLVAD